MSEPSVYDHSLHHSYTPQPEMVSDSGVAIATECKSLGLLLVDSDFSAVRTTPAERILIGKE